MSVFGCRSTRSLQLLLVFIGWRFEAKGLSRTMICSKTINRRGKVQILFHGERREASIRPVDVVDQIEWAHQRNEPPGAFGEVAVVVHQPLERCQLATIGARQRRRQSVVIE